MIKHSTKWGGGYEAYPQNNTQNVDKTSIALSQETQKYAPKSQNIVKISQENDKQSLLKSNDCTSSKKTSVKTNKCARSSGAQNTNINTRVQKNNTAQMFVWLFAMFMLCCGLLLGFTYGALKDSKTATGVISFSLPPTSSATGFNLFLSSDAVYAGDSASTNIVTTNTNNTFEIFLKKNASNVSANAYFKLTFTFYGSQDITYNGNSTYFKTINNTNEALLSYQSKDTTSVTNSTVFTFKTNASLSNYSRVFLDPIIAGFSCSSAHSSNTLEISAYIYNDSGLTTLSSSNSTLCKYLSGAIYSVALTTNSDKCIADGRMLAFEGTTYTFDVTTQTGYEPVVTGLPTGYTSKNFGNVTTYIISQISSNLDLTISSTTAVVTITLVSDKVTGSEDVDFTRLSYAVASTQPSTTDGLLWTQCATSSSLTEVSITIEGDGMNLYLISTSEKTGFNFNEIRGGDYGKSGVYCHCYKGGWDNDVGCLQNPTVSKTYYVLSFYDNGPA